MFNIAANIKKGLGHHSSVFLVGGWETSVLNVTRKKIPQHAISCVNLWCSARWNVNSWGRSYHSPK